MAKKLGEYNVFFKNFKRLKVDAIICQGEKQ
jgi:hypothetical protein